MRRVHLLALAIAAVAVCSGSALAAAADAPLPAGWSHAEINVTGPNGRAHTQVYDRGLVQAVGASSLTLKELDGNVVTIQVAPNAIVRIGARRVALSQIQVGFTARTLGIDGRPAKQVLATRPPKQVVRKLRQARLQPLLH